MHCCRDAEALARLQTGSAYFLVFVIIPGPISWPTIRAVQQRERDLTALLLDCSGRPACFKLWQSIVVHVEARATQYLLSRFCCSRGICGGLLAKAWSLRSLFVILLLALFCCCRVVGSACALYIVDDEHGQRGK